MSRRLKLAFAITAALLSFSQVTPMDQPSPARRSAMHSSHPGSRLGRLEQRVTVLRRDVADLESALSAGSALVADPGLTSDPLLDRSGPRVGGVKERIQKLLRHLARLDRRVAALALAMCAEIPDSSPGCPTSGQHERHRREVRRLHTLAHWVEQLRREGQLARKGRRLNKVSQTAVT